MGYGHHGYGHHQPVYHHVSYAPVYQPVYQPAGYYKWVYDPYFGWQYKFVSYGW
ncbi:MAG: hypothetical protein U0531_08895 [Dehalococcoidia bacterium]